MAATQEGILDSAPVQEAGLTADSHLRISRNSGMTFLLFKKHLSTPKKMLYSTRRRFRIARKNCQPLAKKHVRVERLEMTKVY